MVNLMSLWTLAKKRLSNSVVHIRGIAPVLPGEPHAVIGTIAPPQRWFQDAPDLGSLGCLHSSNRAEVADFVPAFKANDGTPNFISHSQYYTT